MRFVKLRSFATMAGACSCVLACSTLAGISDSTNDTSPAASGNGPQTDPNIAIAGDLGFGGVACGTEATAKLVTIHNTGPSAASYRVVIPDGTPFRIEGPLAGMIDARSGLVTLKVFAKPTLAAATSTDIVISAGSAVQTLTAKASGTGATFTLMPPLVSFGDVRSKTGGGPIAVVATNQGTEQVTVAGFASSPDFVVELASPTLTIPPKGTTTLHATLAAGLVTTAPLHAELAPIVAQKLCGAPPVLTLEGSRVDTDVTVGTADFGRVNCTDNPGAKDIVISNFSTKSDITFSATLPAASPFVITSGTAAHAASGTLPAGTETNPSKTSISVRPNPFGAKTGTVSDMLAVHLTGVATDQADRAVLITADVHGGNLSVQPPSLVGFMPNDIKSFTVTNTGNETVYIGWTFSAGWGESGAPGSLGAGATANVLVQFRPSSNGTYAGTASAQPTLLNIGEPALCTPFPSVTLQGTK